MNPSNNLTMTNRQAETLTAWRLLGIKVGFRGQRLDHTYQVASAIVRFAKPEANS